MNQLHMNHNERRSFHVLLKIERECLSRRLPASGLIESPLAGSGREAIRFELLKVAEKKIAEIFKLEKLDCPMRLPPLTTFIHDLLTRTHLPSLALIVALMYLQRLCHLNPNYQTTPFLAYSGIFTALIVASKFLFDETYENRIWSTLTNIFSLVQINRMEAELLLRLKYNLSFTLEELDSFISEIESKMTFQPNSCNEFVDECDNGHHLEQEAVHTAVA